MKVFVSATSKDLRACRVVVNNGLQMGDIHPVDQEHFPPDHRPLDDYLEATVGACDAVVCLVGHMFGEAPPDAPNPPRSYTQLEYDYARSREKPVFVFIASDRLRSGDHTEPPELQQLQEAHRLRLQDTHKWTPFNTATELELQLARAVPRIRAACGRAPMYYRHLPKPPAWFKGRVEECAQLRKALAGASRSAPARGMVVVFGIGGQGKSTLVHQVLREKLDVSMDSGFWATAHRTGYTFDNFLDDALEHLTNGQFNKQERPEADARVTELLRVMQQNRTLVVLDGLEAWLRDGGAEADRVSLRLARQARMRELDNLLEQACGLSNGSHLIVTSRVWPAVLDQSDVATVPVHDQREKRLGLDGLDPDAAVQLMRSLGVEGDEGELANMARRFDCHPLALQVASGYTVEEYGGLLSEVPAPANVNPDDALQWLFGEVESRLPATDKSRRLLQVISLSQEEPSMPLAAIEHLLSTLNGDDADADNVRPLVSALVRYQLVSYDGRRVATHPLVKQYFGAGVDVDDARRIHEIYYEYYRRQPVVENATTLDDVRPWLLAIEHGLLAGSADLCAELLLSWFVPQFPYPFGEWFGNHGHFSEGADVLQRASALDTGARRHRFLIPRSALCLPVGRVDDAVSDLNAAVYLLADADADPLKCPERAGELAAALSNRGNAHLKVARYDAAQADFNRAVSLFEILAEVSERHWFHAAAVRSNRGMLLHELGKLRDAIQDYGAAVDIYRSRLSPELNRFNNDLAAALCNRGNVYADLRRYSEAREDYTGARDIYKALLKRGRSECRASVARAIVLVATVLQKQNRHAEALAMFDQSIATLSDLVNGGKTHFEPLLTYARMCRALSSTELGQHEEALHESGHARKMYQRLVESGRADLEGQYIHALLVHWYCLIGAGHWEAATPCYLTATFSAQRLIQQGENDLRVIFIRYTLDAAEKTVDQKRDTAVELFEKGLRIAEQALNDWTFGAEAVKAELEGWLAKESLISTIRDGTEFEQDLATRFQHLAS